MKTVEDCDTCEFVKLWTYWRWSCEANLELIKKAVRLHENYHDYCKKCFERNNCLWISWRFSKNSLFLKTLFNQPWNRAWRLLKIAILEYVRLRYLWICKPLELMNMELWRGLSSFNKSGGTTQKCCDYYFCITGVTKINAISNGVLQNVNFIRTLLDVCEL